MIQLDALATHAVPGKRSHAVKMAAESIFAELRRNGYTPAQIVGLSSELIGLVTTEIRPASAAGRADR